MTSNKKKDKALKVFSIIAIILCVFAFALGFIKSQSDDLYFDLENSETVSISSADDIVALGESVYNDELVLANDIHITDSTFRIGTSERPFEGTFNGNGYTVYIDFISADQDTSLFSCISSRGVIKNTTFVFRNITLDGNTFGGIAKINYGTIQDCKIECSGITIDNNKGIYSPCVIINNGTITNVVVECAFSSSTVYKDESSILFGGVCTYNYGTVSNCISAPTFSNIDCTDEFKILTGETTNVGISAICAVTAKGASTTGSVAILPTGVFTSDKNSSGLTIVEDFADILTDDTIFLKLNFSNQIWKIQNNELVLMEG